MKRLQIGITAAGVALTLLVVVLGMPLRNSSVSSAAPATSQAFTTSHLLAHPLQGMAATFYKSPSCDCCHGYAQALEAAGVRVTVVNSAAAMQDAKQRHGIPLHAYSCHTFTLGGYVVEGHVPLEALERLIAERPGVDGIVLPGMPLGTPGMPGEKAGPFEVLELTAGDLAPFMTL